MIWFDLLFLIYYLIYGRQSTVEMTNNYWDKKEEHFEALIFVSRTAETEYQQTRLSIWNISTKCKTQ